MLIKLLKLFKKCYLEKEKLKKKRGGQKEYNDIQIIMIILVMELTKIRDFKAINRYLTNNKKVCSIIGLNKVPHRTTISRRCKKINKKLREVIQSIGHKYCDYYLDSKSLTTSLDSTLIHSAGPLWHKKYRNMGIVPGDLRNVDRDSKWGKSKSKGWVQGYKAHINVVFDESDIQYPPFPIDAVITTANIPDIKKSKTLCSKLPEKVDTQLCDKGYDCEELFFHLLKRKVLLITALKKSRKKEKVNNLRWEILNYAREKNLYKMRSQTVEPFNGRLKQLFGLDPLPVHGKKKVNITILGSILAYQIMVLYNIENKRKPGAVKEVLELV